MHDHHPLAEKFGIEEEVKERVLSPFKKLWFTNIYKLFFAFSPNCHTAVCIEEKMRRSDLWENPLARQAISIWENCCSFVTFRLSGINCSVSADKRWNYIKRVFIHNMVLFVYVTWNRIHQCDIDAYGWAVLKRCGCFKWRITIYHTKKQQKNKNLFPYLSIGRFDIHQNLGRIF